MTVRLGLLMILGLCWWSQSTAQGFYIRGGFGFGIDATKDVFMYTKVERESAFVISNEEVIRGTFGSGPTFRLGGGYMITEYFGVDLEFYYLMGLRQDYGSEVRPDNYENTRSGYTRQFRMTPSLVLKAPGEKFAPYARFGVLLPFAGKQVIETREESFTRNTVTNTRIEITGAFSVGFESCFGVQYNITENLSIFGEMMYSALRVKGNKGTIVLDETIQDDGSVTNHLEGADVFFREFVFRDELTNESNTNAFFANTQLGMNQYVTNPTYNTEEPFELLGQSTNYSSFGLNIGVKYGF